jgi:transposase, IS5 family
MLRLSGGQVETLFDMGLPVEVRELPADLAALDALLADPALLAPVERAWDQAARGFGRPTIPIERLLRLMVLKQRTGWGYETLVREVSDSLHLRRFCRIALTERVPDESTIRKLVRRLGPEVIEQITRVVIAKAVHEQRFVARAARCDSTVVEADIRPPTDIGLAAAATGALAREAVRLRGLAGPDAPRVRDRSRAAGRRLRAANRTISLRTGKPKQRVLALTDEVGDLARRSTREARRLAARLRQRARGRGARAKLRGAQRLEQLAARTEKIADQITRRLAGQKITDRLISIVDPDARPIRKGKLRQPTEFGYVFQLTEVTENTRRGARGLLLPASSQIGNPSENTLLETTATDLQRLARRPREIALDGGFHAAPTDAALPDLPTIHITGRRPATNQRTARRLTRYRVGIEGRISHLKRRYGMRRTRLKGHHGARTWVAWGILAYNLDTLAIRAA